MIDSERGPLYPGNFLEIGRGKKRPYVEYSTVRHKIRRKPTDEFDPRVVDSERGPATMIPVLPPGIVTRAVREAAIGTRPSTRKPSKESMTGSRRERLKEMYV